MTSLAEAERTKRVADVRFDDERMCVMLHDGREISVPLWWYPRLLHATPEQRDNWEILPFGDALHWPDIDEDLDVHGFLIGAKAPDATQPVGEVAPLYLRTGRREDVIASLNHCARCLVWVGADPHEWKWALIAAWCALQGSLLERLRHTDGSGIFKEKDEKALRTWLNAPEPDRGAYPEPFLAPLPDVLRRATSDALVSLSEGQRKAIDRLHAELRNGFMHMSYGGWSIEIAGLPAILLEVLSVVEQLVAGGRFQRHLSDSERAELTSALQQVRGAASALHPEPA